jgi:predicted nucleotidyltransferase component of viral defense system
LTDKRIKNIAASARQRLLNISRESGEDFSLILNRYGTERLLYRLSQSEWRDQFLLKGAMLFSIWQNEPHRPTRDADFLGFVEPEISGITKIFKTLCHLEVEDDGVLFDSASMNVAEIRENNLYEGIRVRISGVLDKANISVQIDIGFGDVVTPGPEEIEIPTFLDQPSPKLKAYPVYTVIAEKFEAMVKLGMINTRMKDFYDLWILTKKFELDSQILMEAIKATFKRRKTAIPTDTPIAFTSEFYEDRTKRQQWVAFLAKNRINSSADLADVTHTLEEFFMPILTAISSQKGAA